MLANAFFVAAEFALARVRPTALEARARAGDASAARALRVLGRLDAYLTATQLGVTLASLGLGWLGEPAIAGGLRPVLTQAGLSESAVHGVAAAVAFSVISALHIVIGELVPKSLAIQRPEDVTRFTAVPLRLFYYGLYPVLAVLNQVSNYLLRKAGGDRSVVERLIEHEKRQHPGMRRVECLERAIARWERENR